MLRLAVAGLYHRLPDQLAVWGCYMSISETYLLTLGEQEATQTGLHTAAVISSPSSAGEVNPQALLSSATVGPNGPRTSGLPTVLPPSGGAAASTASVSTQPGPSPPGAPAIFHPAASNGAAAAAPAPAQTYSFAYARPPAAANEAALYQTSFRIYRHR